MQQKRPLKILNNPLKEKKKPKGKEKSKLTVNLPFPMLLKKKGC